MDNDIYIPYLCYYPNMKPYGACRACLVEVEQTGPDGSVRKMTVASCTTPAAPAMKVVSDNVIVELNEGQFDALVAWTFNLGVGNLRSSTMLKKLNESDYSSVPFEMRRWNKAGGKTLDGLIRRRQAESLLFEGKEWHKV